MDGRLGAQYQVFGVVHDGTPVAFPVMTAAAALENGEAVELAGVSLRLDGGGVRAVNAAGDEIEGHQAFWFRLEPVHARHTAVGAVVREP